MYSERADKYEFHFGRKKAARNAARRLRRRGIDASVDGAMLYTSEIPRWSEVGVAPYYTFPPRP